MNITGNLSSRGLRSFSPSISAMNAKLTDSPSQTTPLLFLGSPAPSSAGGSLFSSSSRSRARSSVSSGFSFSFPDFFAVFTQFASVPSFMPRSRAISAIGRPELITSSTASSLYSWVYFLRACPTSGSLLVDHRATSDGVYETGGGPISRPRGPRAVNSATTAAGCRGRARARKGPMSLPARQKTQPRPGSPQVISQCRTARPRQPRTRLIQHSRPSVPGRAPPAAAGHGPLRSAHPELTQTKEHKLAPQ